jgi:hypothetical protein
MRLALRFLFFDFALSWMMVLAGWARVAVRVRPFLMGTLSARFGRRAWRAGLGLLVGLPVVLGWPLVFRSTSMWQAHAHPDWLKVAIPWWLIVGGCGLAVAVAKGCEEKPRQELRDRPVIGR